MSDPLQPTTFLRHNRQLRALLLESQVWFCARDVSRLIGWSLDERTTRKLDADQRRVVTLTTHYGLAEALMLSESGLYTMLVHHHHAENRGLRQWVTNEVVPALRDEQLPPTHSSPCLGFLQWPGLSVSMLHWQSEPWIRLRDMPRLLPHAELRGDVGLRRVRAPWWRVARRLFG
ncbi:Bro-N domain-containing protein [Xanthomonas sp. WHRI 1810A]|uniref:BRO-N domain-containing protein n=1 Tax=Xanthomonas sp. WHRI 1810A TaxID=3161565 RepID=UPI0032E89485